MASAVDAGSLCSGRKRSALCRFKCAQTLTLQRQTIVAAAIELRQRPTVMVNSPVAALPLVGTAPGISEMLLAAEREWRVNVELARPSQSQWAASQAAQSPFS